LKSVIEVSQQFRYVHLSSRWYVSQGSQVVYETCHVQEYVTVT